MISKSLALKVLNAALATGGDYAEIYLEQTDTDAITLENGKVDTCGGRLSYGAGIRILKKFASVYGYTSDLSPKSLLALAEKFAGAFEGERVITVTSFKKQRVKTVNKYASHYSEVPTEKRIALLKECFEATRAVDPRLVRITDTFLSNQKKIEIFNAEGEVGKWFQTGEERARLVRSARHRGYRLRDTPRCLWYGWRRQCDKSPLHSYAMSCKTGKPRQTDNPGNKSDAEPRGVW